MYDDALPVTGAGALTVGSWQLGLPMVVTIAAGLILAGVVLYRAASWGKRRDAARG